MAIVSTCEKLFSKKVVCRADGTNITFTPAASYQKVPKFATENVAKKPNEPKVATRSQKVLLYFCTGPGCKSYQPQSI